MENYLNYLVEFLKDAIKQANADGLIVGVSGGIDSALVANLVKRACPDNSLGLILPCHSNPQDEKDAQELIDQIGLKHFKVDLSQAYDALVPNTIESLLGDEKSESFKLACGNTKARLRMTTLYAFGQNYNYLVVGTDNAAEWHTGYFTKFGDGGVDLVPLVHLTKGEVYEGARYYNVPKSILEKAPTAGLFGTQTDEQEMGVTYNEIDQYLLGNEVSDHAKAVIDRLHTRSHHKRSGALAPNKIVR